MQKLSNAAGQVFIEALFGAMILMMLVSGLAVLFAVGISKVHSDITSENYLLCRLSTTAPADCLKEFNLSNDTLKSFGTFKIIDSKIHSPKASLQMEFNNRYFKWKLTKTIDLAQ